MKKTNRAYITTIFSALLLTACGGGSGGGEETQPQNVQAVASIAQITVSWDNVSAATGYNICVATETITQAVSCSVFQGGMLIVGSSSPAVIDALNDNTEYFFVVIAQSAGGDAASAVVSATTFGAVMPIATGQLNDTGISLCGDYAFGGSGIHQNDLDCNATDPDGDPIPAGQDAVFGRDASPATNDDSDGDKGFSFTKIGSNGFALTDQSSTTFSCVKDNVTGLIWEVKQTAAGLHHREDAYTWYSTNIETNGGVAGDDSADGTCEGVANNNCNTQAYVARVNAASLCAATDWRLPTRKELRSLVHYGRSSRPVIDSTYFPNTIFLNTATSLFWSSSSFAFNSGAAWNVNFNFGNDGVGGKNNGNRVRLVRSGQ